MTDAAKYPKPAWATKNTTPWDTSLPKQLPKGKPSKYKKPAWATRATKPWDNYKTLPKQQPNTGPKWERKWEDKVPFGRPFLASVCNAAPQKPRPPSDKPWQQQKKAPWAQRSRVDHDTDVASRARRQSSPRHANNTCPWRHRSGYHGPGAATPFAMGSTVPRARAASRVQKEQLAGLVNLASTRRDAAKTMVKTRMTQCPWAGGSDEAEGLATRASNTFGGSTPRDVPVFDRKAASKAASEVFSAALKTRRASIDGCQFQFG